MERQVAEELGSGVVAQGIRVALAASRQIGMAATKMLADGQDLSVGASAAAEEAKEAGEGGEGDAEDGAHDAHDDRDADGSHRVEPVPGRPQ